MAASSAGIFLFCGGLLGRFTDFQGSEVLFGVEGGHAAHAGRGDCLTIDVVDDIDLGDRNIVPDWLDLNVTFEAIDGVEAWSRNERARLKQDSMIGGVTRIRDKARTAPWLACRHEGGKQVDMENEEFPLERLGDLLAQARSHRDRALWALMAGGGLRISEALNLADPPR